jgi:uncharacterized protein (UPF0332 family)
VNQPQSLLDKAQKNFRAAERLLNDGDADIAASRAYYACFYIAEALLATEGYRFKSHGQLVAQYGLRFAQPEKLDRRYHEVLRQAFQTRQIADYQTEVAIDPKVVQELIEGGRSFLAAASRYLEELPGAEGGGRGEEA